VNNDEPIVFAAPNKGTQSKPLRFLATIISYVCHPVFFPLVMAIVIYKLSPGTFIAITPKQMSLWFLNIAITAVFFPLFAIALMKPLGFIQSLHMREAKERTIPLLAIMIFYFWVSHVFNTVGTGQPTKLMPEIGTKAPLVFKVLLLGNFWGVIAVFVINIFVKISMHTAAAGAMIGILVVLMWTNPVDMTLPLLVSIAIAGIIGTARMLLGTHQRGDIIVGYLVGLVAQLGAYVYLK